MNQIESTDPEPVSNTKKRRWWRRLKRALLIVAVIFVLLGSWIAYDIYSPRQTKMRQFDANEVARLETAMWRSYYSRQRVKLFTEASELLRTQYKLPY
jgi:hypothetical protein